MLVDGVYADVLEGIKQQNILPSCLATHSYPLSFLELVVLCLAIIKIGGVETTA